MTRRAAGWATLAVLVTLALATAGVPASAVAAATTTSITTTTPAKKSPCDKGVLGTIGKLSPSALGLPALASPPISAVCHAATGTSAPKSAATVNNPTTAASNAASAVGSATLSGLASFFIAGVTDALKIVEQAATAATAPELTSGWFKGTFAWVTTYAGAFLALAMLGAIIAALLHHRGQTVISIVLDVMLAGLAIGMTIAVAELVLAVANGISQDIVTALPSGWFQTLQDSWSSAGASGFVMLAAIVAILVMGVLFVELVLADAILYMALIFLPVALALGVYPPLAGIRRKLLHAIGMVIFLKPAVLLVLVIGVEVLAGGLGLGGGVASIGTGLAGVGAITLAMFTPWMIMHFLGAGPLQQRANRQSASTSSTTSVGGGLSSASDPFGGSAGSSAGGMSAAIIGAGALALGSAGLAAGQSIAEHVGGRAHAAAGTGSDVPARSLPAPGNWPSLSSSSTAQQGDGDGDGDAGPSQTGSDSQPSRTSEDLLDVFAQPTGGGDSGAT